MSFEITDLSSTFRVTGIEKSRADLDSVKRPLDEVSRKLDGLDAGLGKTKTSATLFSRAFDRVADSVNPASLALSAYGRVLAGVGAALSASKIISVADAYTAVASRLDVATGSTIKTARAQEELFRISQQTRQSFVGTADVFARFATASEQLGVSQERLFGVTRTLNQAITLSGSSSESAKAAMLQLGQGIAAGALRGEELNSVLEQTPAVAKAIADGLGVPVGALKKMGEQGELTSEKVIAALEKAALSVEASFNRTSVTVSGSFQVLANSLGAAVSEADKATGFTQAMAKGVVELSRNIDDARPGIRGFFQDIDDGLTKLGPLLDVLLLVAGGGVLAKAGGALLKAAPKVASKASAFLASDAGLATFALGGAATVTGGAYIASQQKDVDARLAEKAEDRREKNRASFRASEIEQMNGERKKAITTVRELTEAEKQAEKQYQALIAKIRQSTAEYTAQYEAGEDLTQGQKRALEIMVQLRDGTLKLDEAKTKQLATELEAMLVAERATAAQSAFAKVQKEAAAQRYKVIDSVADSTDKIREEIKEIEYQTEQIGASQSALERLEEAKIRDAIATIEQKIAAESFGDANDDLIAQYRKQIDALRDLASARRTMGIAKSAQEDKEKAASAYDSLFKDVSRGLTDSIFRGFEGGKKFISSFKDAIRNAFKSFAIKFAVQPLIGTAIGGLAGAFGLTGLASAAERELGSISGPSILSALNKPVSNGFDVGDAGGAVSLFDAIGKIPGALSGGIAGIETAIYNGFARAGNAVGITGTNNIALANAGVYAGSAAIAYGGYQAGRGISNGYSLNGGTGNATVNVGATLGAIGGAVLGAGNPVAIAIGSAIGSVIGGTVNRLIGSKRVLGASGIEGTFDSDGFAGRTFQDVQIKRKLRSDKNFTNFGTVSGELIDFFSDSLDTLTQSASAAARVLGKDITEGLDKFSISGRFAASSQAQLEETLNRVSDAIIKQTIPAVEEFRANGENLIQTAIRLSDAVSKSNRASAMLGRGSLFTLDNAAKALAFTENLGDTLSGLDSVLQNFVPSSVLAQRRLDEFSASMKALGLSAKITTDTTREQFAALLEQLDLTSDSGQRELAVLLQIAPAVDALIRQRDAEKNAARATTAILDGLVESVSGTTSAFIETDRAITKTRLALFETSDVVARLELEAQLGQQIVRRYELEMQLLGALTQGVSELNVAVADERRNVSASMAVVMGTPLQKDASQIGASISAAALSARLPSLDNVSGAISEVASREEQLQRIGTAKGQLTGAQSVVSQTIAETKRSLGELNSAFRDAGALALTGLQSSTIDELNKAIRKYGTGIGEAVRFDESRNRIVSDFASFGASGRSQAERDAKFGAAIGALDTATTFNGQSTSRRAIIDGLANQSIAQAEAVVASLQAIIATEPAAVRALEAAQARLVEAKKSFADGIQQFVIDAGKAASKLASLREETVEYFQAQQALADLYASASSRLRDTVAGVRFDKLSQQDQFVELRSRFDTAVLLAQSLTGDALVAQSDKIGALIEPILRLGSELAPGENAYAALESSVLAQAEQIASRIDGLAPRDFQRESIDLLGQIDGQLALIEANTSTAEKLIVDAINISRDRTLEGLRGVIAAVRGEPVPGFVSGTSYFAGGIRVVGERGAEIESTGASRIFNAQQTRQILSGRGGDADMLAQLAAIEAQLAQFRQENMAGQSAIAVNTSKAARVLERADNGESLNITMVTE